MSDIKVIYEDNHLIAINKPCGVLVQGDSTGDQPISENVKAYIKYKYNKPGDVFLGLLHRLDRPVSGVLIFARTSKALVRMNELMRKKAIRKSYLAIVTSPPPQEKGRVENYIVKDHVRNRVRLLDKPSNRAPDAKLSVTNYELLGGIDGNYLIRVHPETGRPHQIRVHLSSIGCPIKGDTKYKASSMLKDKSILLHCEKMTFVHPVKKEEIFFEAKPPKHIEWDRWKEILRR